MASTGIDLQQVSVRFGAETLFTNVSLSIAPAERFVLIGPSGRGKSVLLKVMAGIFAPTSGRVLIGGRDLYGLPERERFEIMRQMGMLFQKNALFDSMTVADNIAFPLRETTSLSEAEIQERVAKFLDAVGIAHARDLFPDEISGGMQKRLGIARALALKPQIILYDDPTAGLDPITSRKIIDLILELQREARSTVVAITNDMARAYQMAGRIAMVADGEVIITGTVAETLEHRDPRVHQFIRGLIDGPLTAEARP